MSRYYSTYPQYLGASKCCDLRTQGPAGPEGPAGPTGPCVLKSQHFCAPKYCG